MTRTAISTDTAPQAIGAYSQAIRAGNTVYLSGQIPLDPVSMTLVSTDIEPQIEQVFRNLAAVAAAAGGSLDDAVKLTVYLVDLGHFPQVNEAMTRLFTAPYPARATVQISALPKGALVEVDAVLVLPG
ncbi:MAG: Rid family detoxifying hydrolase [Gammaproteobacteria bacterium]|jgi:reactive intermediate/imine deaminase|nr:Rid family detoxifying hydrolase [Gammaproteobacteria bacterium]